MKRQVTLLLLSCAFAGGAWAQAVTDEPAVASKPSPKIVTEYVEIPAEVGLGTMAIHVWAKVAHADTADALSGATFFLQADGVREAIPMEPIDGAFDSAVEEVVANVDTYTWVREAAYSYEIRATLASGASAVAARGVVSVRMRLSTPDLVVFDAAGTVHAWVGSGAGGFTTSQSLAAPVCVGKPWTVDLDGNGFDDVLCKNERGQIEVFKSRSASRLEIDGAIDVGGAEVVGIAVGDLDGNAMPDIVSITADRFLEIRQDLSDVPSYAATLTLHPETLALADLNGDGIDEIYVGLLGLSEGEIQSWSRVEADWVPDSRLAVPPGERGRIQRLVRANAGSKDVLFVLATNSQEQGTLESWTSAADTESGWKATLRGRFPVPGEPLDVLGGRFRQEAESWVAIVRDGAGAALFGIRDGQPLVRLGALDAPPTATAVLDLDGDGDDDLVTGGDDVRLWINVRGEAFREAGESPYLLEEPVTALASGSLDERRP